MPLTLTTPAVDTVRKRELVNLCCEAMDELKRACAKFPAFPDRLVGSGEKSTPVARQLELARACNDRDEGRYATGYSVFCEEFLEFIQAAEAGDRAAAEKELVQAMAMLMRIRLHLAEYCAKKGAVGK